MMTFIKPIRVSTDTKSCLEFDIEDYKLTEAWTKWGGSKVVEEKMVISDGGDKTFDEGKFLHERMKRYVACGVLKGKVVASGKENNGHAGDQNLNSVESYNVLFDIVLNTRYDQW